MAAILPDPEAGVAFYTELFGWRADPMDIGGFTAAMWRLPGFEGGEPGQPVPSDVVGVMLLLPGDQGPDGPPPHWGVDFWVTDADAATTRATDLGASVLAPPFDTPVGRSALVAHPQGATFSLSTVPTPALAPLAAAPLALGGLHLPLPLPGPLPLGDLLLLIVLDPAHRSLLLVTPGVRFLFAHPPPPCRHHIPVTGSKSPHALSGCPHGLGQGGGVRVVAGNAVGQEVDELVRVGGR